MQHAVAADKRLMASSRKSELYAWGEGGVLKLPRPGRTHVVAVEEANTRAVQQTGLPVRRVLGRVEVDGRPGLLLERVDGEPLQAVLARSPRALRRAARLLAAVHAQIHGEVAPGLHPLRAELEHYIAASPLAEHVREVLLRRLCAITWDDRVCHGDFHPGNLMLTRTGGVRVIDWAGATHGPPLYDVARTSLALRMGPPPDTRLPRWLTRAAQAVFCDAYLRRYFQLRPGGRDQLPLWQAITGARLLAEGALLEPPRLLAAIHRGARIAARE